MQQSRGVVDRKANARGVVQNVESLRLGAELDASRTLDYDANVLQNGKHGNEMFQRIE
jgi:hypothetical protein